MLVYSFCQTDDLGLGQVIFKFTWDNYARVFIPEYIPVLIKSVVVAIAIIVVGSLIVRFFKPSTQAVRDRTFLTPRQWVVWTAVIAAYLTTRHTVWQIELDEDNHLKTLMRSIELAGLATIVCVFVGYPVAYFIGRSREGIRNLLLLTVMIPFWTNFLIRTFAWVSLLKDEGILNAFLQWTHVIAEPLHLNATPTAVVIGTVYAYLPFMILPIYGSVEKLDQSLIEASFDLGANPVRAFMNVILPLTRPGIAAGVLLVFVPAVGTFVISDILGGGRVLLIGNTIDNQFHASQDKPFGSALGILLTLLFAIAYFVSLRRKEQN
jgi:spermidine/putrescine transport system permease protein